MNITKRLPFDFKTQYGLGFNPQDDEIVVDFFCGGVGAGTGLEIGLGRAVSVAKNHSPAAISMHQVSETSASRSSMDQIEARSKETLPTSLVYSVVPYEGLTEQQIQLRLSVITSGAQPLIKLRWVAEDLQREEIAQEFKSVLEAKVDDAAQLALGSFSA
ncbi:DUF2303 family protein [Pseudomonas alliivorans]|uniref:DUF2303 family protein n=1 Tax=Pseudomonas alliivorans TaxID=2810613 RepID=UPI0039E00E46